MAPHPPPTHPPEWCVPFVHKKNYLKRREREKYNRKSAVSLFNYTRLYYYTIYCSTLQDVQFMINILQIFTITYTTLGLFWHTSLWRTCTHSVRGLAKLSHMEPLQCSQSSRRYSESDRVKYIMLLFTCNIHLSVNQYHHHHPLLVRLYSV